MGIEEIKQAKIELQNGIAALCAAFHANTGLVVDELKIVHYLDKPYIHVPGVRCVGSVHAKVDLGV